MEKITLTEAQKAKIIERLAAYHDGNQDFDFNEDFDGSELVVNVKGFIETRSHCEDDRERGTGAWVEDYRDASVELTGWLYNPATEDEVEVEIDDNGAADKYMNAA